MQKIKSFSKSQSSNKNACKQASKLVVHGLWAMALFSSYSALSMPLLATSELAKAEVPKIEEANTEVIKLEIVQQEGADLALNKQEIVTSEQLIKESETENHALAKQSLMMRLSQNSQFSATFSQQVLDEEKNVLQQSEGKLAVKQPDLVYWHTQQPEESLIVSDGSSLWFYDPFIEQATAYDVKTSIANTPILLLTSTDETLWQQYGINQLNQDNYTIQSLDTNSRVKTLTLNFEANTNRLASFSILDSTGQLSVVQLSDVDTTTIIADTLFKFTLPEGVYLDDQR